VIDRRHIGSASLNALEFIHDKDRWQKVGQEAFILLTSVNHISVRPEIGIFALSQGGRQISSAGIVNYFEELNLAVQRRQGVKRPFMDGH